MKFAPGDRVRVLELLKGGHVRTPSYVRGKDGWIERVHGEFRNPESLAYGGDGLPRESLYLVGFSQAALWADRYKESRTDHLYVDIYEHWLGPAGDA